jgi:hypothetical protein
MTLAHITAILYREKIGCAHCLDCMAYGNTQDTYVLAFLHDAAFLVTAKNYTGECLNLNYFGCYGFLRDFQ